MKNHIENILIDSFPQLTLRKGQPTNDLVVDVNAAINESLMAEMESVRNKLSIANYQNMTPDELDLLASNYLQFERKITDKARGILRIYTNQKTDLVFSRDRNYFKTANNFYFRPIYDFAISNIELQFDDSLKLYYIDILIESIVSLSSYTVIEPGKVNTYIGENPFVERITNIGPLVVSTTLESNYDVYSRLTEWGVLTNPTRKNFLGALILNTFPDARRIILAGSGHRLMKRDLTFNYLNAISKVEEFNFFSKKTNSSINNSNYIFKGLMSTIDPLYFGLDPLGFLKTELSQDEYESIAFRDGGSAECSTLLSEIFFPGILGYSYLLEEGMYLSETNMPWDTGSSKVTFTNDVASGIEVKGSYVENEELVENEKGVVFYKKVGDPRNKEFALQFIIRDFVYETTIAEQRIDQAGGSPITQSITLSNNKPLYFTVLKKGKDDQERDIVCSSYDGYGVVIMKKFTDQRPNVFIIDGSSGVGDIAFEDEILQYGSERVLAGKYIPLEKDITYNCIMQLNDSYGMNVFFKDQYNSYIGTISVGSGGLPGAYQTIYNAEDNDDIQVKTDFVADDYTPRQYKFISSIEDDLQCSGILNLKFLEAYSNSNLLTYISGSLRILHLSTSGSQFSDFRNIESGDLLEVNNQKYLIKRKIDNQTIEANENVTLLPGGSTWKVWKDLKFGEDFIIPQLSSYNNLTILGGENIPLKGVEKIINIVGNSNLGDVKYILSYIQKNGMIKNINFGWTDNVTIFKAFNPKDTDDDGLVEENIKLKEVYIFDQSDLTIDEDFFFASDPVYKKVSSFYLTQEGFNKISSKFIRLEMSQNTVERDYLLEKNSYIKGYQVLIGYKAGVKNITYLHKCYDQTREFVKGSQYYVSEPEVTDITINPNDLALFFDKSINFEYEVVGTGIYENIEVTGCSSVGDNKIYTSLSSPLNNTYFSILIDGERFFIQEIVEDLNTPFLGKTTKITVDRNVDILDNITVELRKNAISTISTSKAKFGYKYDIKIDSEVENVWDTDVMTYNLYYGSQNLIFGQDFESDRNIPLSRFYLSSSIYNLVSTTSPIIFRCDQRVVREEIIRNKEYEFYPISTGSYLGIGFKNVNNGHWNLLELRIRQLLERYSAFHVKLNVGKNVKNEDRLFLDINSYALNLNSIETKNGINVYIYNKLTDTWELLFQNQVTSSLEGSKYLQFFEGDNIDQRKYSFGYFSGSNFYVVNDSFYPANYVDNNGFLNLFITSRGKTDINFSGDIIISEAKLFLDYINLTWQKDVGVHTGNKIDIWVASDTPIKTNSQVLTLTESVNELELDESISRPVINILSIKNSLGLDIPFQMVNLNSNLRFSTKERIKIIFSYQVTPGDYFITYDYIPHIGIKQNYIDSLNREVDVLVRNMPPAFVKLNISYSGNIDETVVKNALKRYIQFGNFINLDFIETIMKNYGASYVSLFDYIPLTITEYDMLLEPITLEHFSSYALKEEKYFDIKLSDINLIKI
jgi:hypothetical protein